MMSSATWNAQDQAMAAASDDDFQQFLDISSMGNMADGMQFDFQGFQDDGSHSLMAQPRQTADAIMSDTDPSGMIPRSDGLLQNHTPVMAPHAAMPAHMMAASVSREAISNIDAQIQYLQQQKFQQQQRQLQEQQATFFVNHGHSVPPTPQSLEMTPGSGQFFSQAEQMPSRGAYDRSYHQRMAEQDMAFTPLVSPAVTPLDPHFHMDNAFTVPGAYFSPLTSPALHAQNDSSSNYDHTTHSNNSPIDMDLEAPAIPAVNLDMSKKTRKTQAAKTRSKPGVKSSPISKPLRRKTGPSPAMVSQVLSEVEERSLQASDHGLLPLPAASTDGSDENASVSPENLSEMPPPPIPTRRSMSKSPYILPQTNMQPSHVSTLLDEQHPPHPATPASLMKLPASKTKKLTTSHQEPPLSDNIESLELPESISNPSLAGSLANVRLASQTPRPEPNLASKGVTFQSMPSPVVRATGTSSANQSPLLLPGPSSSSNQRKTPQLSSRNSRKRSTGSVHASPALLPRISPNIKPLLPGAPGMSVEDQASRLLMSKSNYQNILEGNQVPGVSYPSELSTNLTSKRTSHKIAEQGRRNRINSALQTMASLLPDGKDKVVLGDEDDKKDGKQSHASNSKASVVENAIVHMKKLEKENVDLKQELQALKDQLEKLKGSDGVSGVSLGVNSDDKKLPNISEEQNEASPDAQGDMKMTTSKAADEPKESS
ncbi:phosphorus acquisition-controlling [Trichoderma arundinaceum]|uniref:Phosphorus acquisition-controlling n=1 Tax=Trichoderma arundinaceum TaxID=490622 RepID=A0A395N7D7_TRIAR|nr:phosphorus acquisition-controlling [Trichoderma arundinaceum]